MSQLQTNLTNLQTILDSVNNLPEATTLPTCTVNLISGDATFTLASFTEVDTTTGKISSTYLNTEMNEVTLNGILCNSIITFVAKDASSITANDNCKLFFGTASSGGDINVTVGITAPDGGTANIILT